MNPLGIFSFADISLSYKYMMDTDRQVYDCGFLAAACSKGNNFSIIEKSR
jgi:hypothetical protein